MRLGEGLSRHTVGRSFLSRFAARFDWPLFVTVLLICGIGLVNLYSALSGRGHALFTRQVIFMSFGLCVYLGMTAFDYRLWQRFAWWILGGAVSVLLLVAVIGFVAKGARRWIDLGFVAVQPSELAKIAVIMALARVAQDSEGGDVPRPELAVKIGFLCLVPGLILIQPDLGTASLCALIMLSVGFCCARRLWPLYTLLGVGLASLPFMWDRMHQYQRDRVLAFLDPGADPTGVGWHTSQSILAVGSGRMTGSGWLNGSQNRFRFLPEQWTDFPFSVWAEEWGFLGCLVLLALFVFLIVWIVNVALNARDRFGAVLCLGVAAMILWHTFVNIAMVLGLAPVVGVTLPLVSYGGSSLVTILAGLGLVSSVSARRHGY